MKKLITLLLIVGMTSLSFGQDINYGVHFATNVSNMDYDEDGIRPNPHRNGFVFGVFADFGLSDNLAVMTELQYSPEGANSQYFKTDYLNLPVILNYNIFGGLKIGVGPQVGLKIHKHRDGFRNLLFSGVGLAEYMITDEIGIDFRYIYGISNVFDDELNLKATQGVMQFGFTYRL